MATFAFKDSEQAEANFSIQKNIMQNKTIPIDNILYSCNSKVQRSEEQFVEDHALLYVLSGEINLITADGSRAIKAGTMCLVKRNQLAKTVKVPPPGSEFKSINIFLTQEILRKYSVENGIQVSSKHLDQGFYEFTNNPFLKGFFLSIQPYFQEPDKFNSALTVLKTKEAIEIILLVTPALKNVLFDFREPYKIDLEAFMLQNYKFNVSLDALARLTGRSRAGFKRDFEKIFNTSPGRWLKQTRLEEAYSLIKKERMKPSDVYLEVGFENLSHFSTAFKEAFGVNPSQAMSPTTNNI